MFHDVVLVVVLVGYYAAGECMLCMQLAACDVAINCFRVLYTYFMLFSCLFFFTCFLCTFMFLGMMCFI